MRKYLVFIYKLMFFLVPIPLFFDFGNMQFVIINISEYNLFYRPSVPMPIGGIALFFAVLIGYICSIFYNGLFQSVFVPAKLIVFYALVVMPISIYSVFVADLSVPRLFQLILPMVFVSLLSFPVLIKDRLDLLRNTFISGLVFFGLHFLSVVSTSKSFLSVDDGEEFSSFFGILIYQSLVAYPAVLSLYLFLAIGIIYVARNEILPEFKKYKVFAYFLVSVLLYLLAASGRRAFLVEYVCSLVVIISFSLFYILTNRYIKRKTIWYFLLFIILFFSFFVFYINTPLSNRVLVSIESNAFDSGRISILRHAFDFYTENLAVFFWGGGQRDVPGFHNFILDQIYRVGLVGMLFVYITMLLLINRFVRANDVGSKYTYHRRMFISIFFGLLFMQSMINASVSQPYYFVNFLIVTVLVYFVLFSRKDSSYKSQCSTQDVTSVY